MKYTNITALLGLTALTVKAGFFGKNPHASLDEEQLEKIDAALAQNPSADLQQKLSALEAQHSELQNAHTRITNALEQALQVNEIDASDSIEDSIVALGETCKAYGESANRHTFAAHNGQDQDPSTDGLIDGYFNPNDQHNKI
ncbi:MAG: hypothetical protein Q4F57_05990 [Weeksellaceae bacterium]|nr:hypothetical protein [Weeksellaceae bacterium]